MMRRILFYVAVLAGTISSDSWSQYLGPWGTGWTLADYRGYGSFLIKGGDIFQVAPGRIFRYKMSDSLWSQSSSNQLGVLHQCIVSDSHDNLYIGTDGQGVVRTTDNGITWTNSITGMTDLDDRFVNALAVDSSAKIIAGTNVGIFISTDSGTTWSPKSSGITDNYITALLVCPNGTIFAGTEERGIFLSTNGGASWTASNTGITDTTITALAIGPSGAIYAGTYLGGLFISTNNGSSWLSLGLRYDVSALAVSSSGIIYAQSDTALFRSSNEGASWTFLSGFTTDAYYYAPGTIIANALAVDNRGKVFAANFDGSIYSSADSGEHWTKLSSKVTRLKVTALTLDNSGMLYAGTENNGIFVSSGKDAGDWWINPGLKGISVLALTTISDKMNGTIAFAGTQGKGLFRSSDKGVTWTTVSNGLTDSIITAFTADSAGFVFAGTQRSGVFVTSDEGLTWAPANNGITNLSINCLAFVHTEDTSFLFVATNGGVFLSKDHGSSWNPFNIGLTNLHVLSLTFQAPAASASIVFAGTSGSGIFRSSINGPSWISVNAGLVSLTVQSMAVNPSLNGGYGVPPPRVFAGSDTSGVFYSSGDSSWSSYNHGLSNLSVHAIAPYYAFNSASFVYVGTDAGVFVAGLSPATGVRTAISDIPTAFQLQQNFPNPFNPSTTIRFSLSTRSRVRLTIYNLLGQRVTELATEEMGAGNFERVWKANVASGLYFYRLEAVSVTDPNKRFVDVKKMILLK